MKVVILAGGYGTRISEESHIKPKPMIEIGGKPILWHIMKEYSYYGFTDFIICCGYKQHVIKEYFADYYLHNSEITFDFSQRNKMIVHSNVAEPWKVTLIDTGLNTMTGGRLKRIQNYVEGESFMMTYGDGVADIPIDRLLEFHKKHGKIATMSAVSVAQRFGILDIDNNDTISDFREKSRDDETRINGGYMVFKPEIFDFIEGDATILEKNPLKNLCRIGELKAFKHDGFWQCMDTQREKEYLEDLWVSHNAPWKVWES